jgi:hypothetical protein
VGIGAGAPLSLGDARKGERLPRSARGLAPRGRSRVRSFVEGYEQADWPRYMMAKPLKGRVVAYYWNPAKRDVKAGFPLERQALGTDYGQARIRCDGDQKDPDNRGLNGFLDDWRAGRHDDKQLDLMPA